MTVRVKLLEQDRKSSHKEYAYLKSALVSKRLTILINMEDSSRILDSSRLSDKPSQ